MPDTIVIVDFGSQYTNVIARRIREIGVYSEVVSYRITAKSLIAREPKGIILSGGPDFVTRNGSPTIDPQIFSANIPILGICYGLQLMAHLLGGSVAPRSIREYGPAMMTVRRSTPLLKGIPKKTFRVWMSHGDQVTKLPSGFHSIANSSITRHALIANERRQLYGIQFHPEVTHTQYGNLLLKNFALDICQSQRQWKPASWIDAAIARISQQVGAQRAVCALSGGVDSTVAALLVSRAIGKQLQCVYVDTGLMRHGETKQVLHAFRILHLSVKHVHSTPLFLRRLKGVTDPEQKRKIIGKTFIDVFEREAQLFNNARFLVQGTLYSDVIESAVSSHDAKLASQTIKSHHNVGGLPARLNLRLVEPLRELFKDEARSVGKRLGVPPEIINRHPFPGPGLAIRIIGEVTPKRLVTLRSADAILTEEIKKAGWYDRIWQSAAILTGVRSTAVLGDARVYHEVCAIRLVRSQDAMTAHWVKLPHTLLERISNRIVNEVRGVTRVVYDITNKPPATIEWE